MVMRHQCSATTWHGEPVERSGELRRTTYTWCPLRQAQGDTRLVPLPLLLLQIVILKLPRIFDLRPPVFMLQIPIDDLRHVFLERMSGRPGECLTNLRGVRRVPHVRTGTVGDEDG